MTSPTATESPSLTKTSMTVPEQGALTTVSIFMASTTSSGSFISTTVPGDTLTLNILPAKTALTARPDPDGPEDAAVGVADTEAS